VKGLALVAASTLALVVTLAPNAPALAADAQRDPEALVSEAVAAYGEALGAADRGVRLEAFRRAERLFAKLGEDGAHNADLYTNLGNAALQAERPGQAVLAYRRALRLDPSHSRALQNLEHARALLPAWLPRPEPAGLLDSFFFWHRTLSRADRALVAALCFAAAGLLAAASIRFAAPALRNAALLPALAWLALIGSLVLDDASAQRDAAVVTAESTARAADSALAPAALGEPLPAGAEVRVLETRSPWLRVRLANGRDVWVSEADVTRIGTDG
jgi:tetratricopeptide (TPR) repeat protein